MKKILTLILLILTLGLFFGNYSVKASSEDYIIDSNKWTFDDVLYNYNWSSESNTFDIENINFNNYIFEYFKTGDGWKVLVPSSSDKITLKVLAGNNYVTRSIFLNDNLLVTGTIGLYGNNINIFFRYKLATTNLDPENPSELESYWVSDNNFYKLKYNIPSTEGLYYIPINIDNIAMKVIEYKIVDNNTNNDSNYNLVTTNPDSKLFIKILVSNNFKIISLVKIDGVNEIVIASSNLGYFGNTVINETLKVRYMTLSDIEETDIDSLPLTTTNIGSVQFFVTGYNLLIMISYDNFNYYLKYSFEVNTDMNIFKQYKEAFFLNKNGLNPQIFINNSNESLSEILNSNEDYIPHIPHTVFDLKTNAVKTINAYETYVHLKQNDKGVVVAYMYIDNYIIDKILSMELSFTSRVKRSYIFGLWDKVSEWETYFLSFENDDYLEYKDKTYDWQYFIPFWNIGKFVYNNVKTYEMPFITAVNWNNIQSEYNITKTELNTYFNKLDQSFIGISNNDDYKVWAIALESGIAYDIGIYNFQTEIFDDYSNNPNDDRNFHIISIKYETNGVLYEALGSEIDLKTSLDHKIDGLLKDTEANWLDKLLDSLGSILLVFGIGILFLAGFKANAFSTPRKAIGFLISTGLIIGVLYIVYIFIS